MSRAQTEDRQKNERQSRTEKKGRGQGTVPTAEAGTGEMYLDVRICCTCCGVSAKVKCASSNLWLEVDAEDTKTQSLPSPGLRSHLLPSQTAETKTSEGRNKRSRNQSPERD